MSDPKLTDAEIITRLRQWAEAVRNSGGSALLNQAADAIQRLSSDSERHTMERTPRANLGPFPPEKL